MAGENEVGAGQAPGQLMYLADPASALRQAASLLRPGGLVCLHEADLTYMWSSVETPT